MQCYGSLGHGLRSSCHSSKVKTYMMNGNNTWEASIRDNWQSANKGFTSRRQSIRSAAFSRASL